MRRVLQINVNSFPTHSTSARESRTRFLTYFVSLQGGSCVRYAKGIWLGFFSKLRLPAAIRFFALGALRKPCRTQSCDPSGLSYATEFRTVFLASKARRADLKDSAAGSTFSLDIGGVHRYKRHFRNGQNLLWFL